MASADGPTVFAGFWIRVGASLIDQVIVLGAFLLLFVVIAFSVLVPPLLIALMVLVWILSILAPWLYYALFESSEMQATPGKRAVGIKVTDLQGNRISFGRATGRHFAEWITGMTLFIGYVMVAFTQKRQSLHDLIAGTVVVAAGAAPAEVATAPPAKPMSGWGIAAIFLLGLIPMIGILAAISIPAYQDYTVRAQVTEGLVVVSGIKAEVETIAAASGQWPRDLADAKLDSTITESVDSTRYLESVELSNGTITITYGREADRRIQNKRLSLRPYITGDGAMKWLCGRAAEPEDAYFSIDDAGQESDLGTTNVQDKYLPKSCRTGFIPTEESFGS